MIPSLRTTEQWKTELRENAFYYHAAVPWERADGGAHQTRDTLGYRIGKRLAYITDMLTMPESEYELLNGLDVQ
mgnify:CR=1 FL=1